MPEAQEVNLKNPSDEEEEMLNPTKIFNIHNTGFKQKLISNTGGTAYIELYPNDLNKKLHKNRHLGENQRLFHPKGGILWKRRQQPDY